MSNMTSEAETTAICAECGAQVGEDDATCSACGATLATSPEALATEELTTVIVVDNAEDEDESDVGEDDQVEEAAEALPTWEGELAFEGLASSDGRVLMAGQITNRDLPLSLMFQYVTAEGHMGAEACGKITNIWREPRPMLGPDVVAVMGSGEFSTDLMGPTAAAAVGEQIVRHVSVDVAAHSKVLLSAETLQEVPEEEQSLEAYMNGEYLVGIGGEIMGATIVPFSAFADAQLRTVDPGSVMVASAWTEQIVGYTAGEDGEPDGKGEIVSRHLTFVSSPVTMKIVPRSLTAAAAGIAPVAPPKDWFFTPEPEGKFPLTVMDDGRIMGHLATWDQCHHGFANECVLAKPSRSGYAFFHTGALKTKEGELVEVGRIVVGETAAKGHASVEYSLAEATSHYDKTALVGAFVRAVDGQYGIWLSGVVRSDCPSERVRDMLANPPSGDWRQENGWLELIAALSVPVPGFPVPRYEYAMVASADSSEIKTFIGTGYYELEPPSLSRAEQRRKHVLLAKAEGL